tara:strand:- start:11785 stop:11964 length:180 start_codon:yes stop_codon:yes gene_type:complete
MTIKEFKDVLKTYNDNDVVVVEVHDTILSEDLYEFYIDDTIHIDDRKEIRICPIKNQIK